MLIVSLVACTMACFVVWHECDKQRKFEEYISKEWNSMTQEERDASGREDMYC